MRLRIPLAVALVVVMMMAPNVAAVHGAPYVAKGVAYLRGDTVTPPIGWLGPVILPATDATLADAVVEWGGFWAHRYKVTITDHATGEILVQKEFMGHEAWGCCYVPYLGEFFQYHGWSDPSVVGVDFDVYGLQWIGFYGGGPHMLYSGWYNEYAMVLYVDNFVDQLV